MKRIILILVACVMLAGCGGGGSDSTQSFTTSDFSGKTLYSVGGDTTQPASFRENGAVVTDLEWSAQTQTYVPMSAGSAKWAVVDGALVITTDTDTGTYVKYSLLNNDTANRFYSVKWTSKDGQTGTAGIFYDQVTGYDQSKAYVIARYKP